MLVSVVHVYNYSFTDLSIICIEDYVEESSMTATIKTEVQEPVREPVIEAEASSTQVFEGTKVIICVAILYTIEGFMRKKSV